MEKFVYQFQVEWGDTDAAGIVYSPNFYKWMDEATHHFFAYLGFPLSKLISVDKIGIPALESNLQFKKALRFEETFEITSALLLIKDKVFTIEHTFIKDGEEIAKGRETRALASIAEDRLKAISIPEDIRQALNDYMSVVSE